MIECEHEKRSWLELVLIIDEEDKSKSKPPVKQQKSAPKIQKSKIEKEFEKLSREDKLIFYRKLVSDESFFSLPVDKEDDQISLSHKSEHDAILRENPTTIDNEKDLYRLRMQLGEVLNQQADLRTKEKKLKLAIKKLQRKLASAHKLFPAGMYI